MNLIQKVVITVLLESHCLFLAEDPKNKTGLTYWCRWLAWAGRVERCQN